MRRCTRRVLEGVGGGKNRAQLFNFKRVYERARARERDLLSGRSGQEKGEKKRGKNEREGRKNPNIIFYRVLGAIQIKITYYLRFALIAIKIEMVFRAP